MHPPTHTHTYFSSSKRGGGAAAAIFSRADKKWQLSAGAGDVTLLGELCGRSSTSVRMNVGSGGGAGPPGDANLSNLLACMCWHPYWLEKGSQLPPSRMSSWGCCHTTVALIQQASSVRSQLAGRHRRGCVSFCQFRHSVSAAFLLFLPQTDDQSVASIIGRDIIIRRGGSGRR